MRMLCEIGSYAGPTAFLAAAVLAGAFTTSVVWLGGDAKLRRFSGWFGLWLLACGLLSAGVVLVSNLLLQRQVGVFEFRNAAGAAAVMGLFTAVFLIVAALREEKLTRGIGIFLLVAGSVAGTMIWFFGLALIPRIAVT